MAEKNIKLICKSNALVHGKVVKAKTIDSYPEGLAKELLASNRFEPAKEPAKKQASGGK